MSIKRLLLPICVAAATAASLARAEQQERTDLERRLQRLRVGMWVQVEGRRTADGVLEAARVRVYAGERDEVEIESEVAAVDLVRMTLKTTLGLRVTASSSTEIEGPGGKRQAVLAALAAGDRIDVEGQLEKDGSLRAEKIDVEKEKRPEPGRASDSQHELKARIESIDLERRRIVVLGLPVQLRATTRLRLPD